MSVLVESRRTTSRAGTPTKLFVGPYAFASSQKRRNDDGSVDGQRFLLVKPVGAGANAAPPQLVVIQYADQELARLAPRK